MDVEPKIGVKPPQMDGENKGSKPYEQMDDLGGFPIIFGLTPILFRPLHVSHRGVICKSSSQLCTTVDGRNPAPPGMYNTLQKMGYLP